MFHKDISGAVLYALVYGFFVVLFPVLFWLFWAILRSAIQRWRSPDKNAPDPWKHRIDFRMEFSVLLLILFEAFVGLLSLHLQKDESAVQDASATILNDRMGQTVTELQKAGNALSDGLNFLKGEHAQEMRDRAKKPILTLVTSKQLSDVKTSPWSPISSPVPVEQFVEHPCGSQQIRPGRIFLAVQNKGEVRATNGSLAFVLPYSFNVKCFPMTCQSQPQDSEINPDTDVTVPFEVPPHGMTKITMEFSAGHETVALALRQVKMKTDQTDEQDLGEVKVITCLAKTKP